MPVRRPSGSTPGIPSTPDASAARISVPRLNKNPVWSLRPWPVSLQVAGTTFEIPAMPAADWLVYLMQETPDIDGLIVDLLPESDELLYDGFLDIEDLYEATLELIATVCARPWWIALRQVRIAFDSWQILGPEMLGKVNFEQVSIAAWLDVLLITTINAMDPKDVTMFTLRLEAPPPQLREENDPMETMEMDRGAFLSLG